MSLTTHLLKAGHDSVVATDPRGMLYARLREAKAPVIALQIRNHLDLWAAFQLRQLIRRGAYHIVHFHTARAHAMSLWLYGLQVKRLVTRRMDYPLRAGIITRLLYIHCVEMVVAISHGVSVALTAGNIPPSRIRLIPSGVDTMRFAPNPAVRERVRLQHGLDPHTPLIISVGALVDRKGHELLLAAARHLKEKGRHAHYLICGEGPLRATLEEQARAFNLSSEVRFTGFCANISELLAAADIFVHVPHYEGLGVAVIEALAAGLPTVASQVGGLPELIMDGETGILIPPQDAESLSTTLIYLLNNSILAWQLGKAGQTFVRNHYDVGNMAKTNETLYMELLADAV